MNSENITLQYDAINNKFAMKRKHLNFIALDLLTRRRMIEVLFLLCLSNRIVAAGCCVEPLMLSR